MSDPTSDADRPGSGPDPTSAPQDDPGARAKADVRAILARALGLRRIVELAAEIRSADPAPVEPPPPRRRRTRRHQPG